MSVPDKIQQFIDELGQIGTNAIRISFDYTENERSGVFAGLHLPFALAEEELNRRLPEWARLRKIVTYSKAYTMVDISVSKADSPALFDELMAFTEPSRTASDLVKEKRAEIAKLEHEIFLLSSQAQSAQYTAIRETYNTKIWLDISA